MYTERNSKNKLYVRWLELRRRCRKPRQDSYCRKTIWWSDEFDDYDLFRQWSLDNGFNESLSLDRIDNSLGYSPENCQWTDRTAQQYNQHKKVQHNLTSKYRGVSFDKRRNKFRARIYIDRKEVLLGYFTSEEDAAIAYNEKIISSNINAPKNIVLTN